MPNYNNNGLPFGLKVAFTCAGAVASVILLLIIWPFSNVPAGTVGVPTNFGAPQAETLNPGIHFVMPIRSAIYDIDVTPNTVPTTESASTHDQQNVNTGIAITYQADPLYAVYIYQNYRSVSNMEQTIIAPIVSNDVKAIVAQYDAQDLITERDLVSAGIKDSIAKDLRVYHLIVDGANITNFQFSDAYDQAIEDKQIAQQSALEEKYKLQQVQVSAQQQVVQADAQAQAAVDVAQGLAKATVLQAQADATAYTLKQKSLTPELVELALINKWSGVMPTYTSNALPTTLFGINPAAAPAQ